LHECIERRWIEMGYGGRGFAVRATSAWATV